MTTTPSEQATCPSCGSSSIQAVAVDRRNLASAAAAQYFLGVAAGVAAGATTLIQVLCLRCGCRWVPGTQHEQDLRALSGQLGEEAQRAAKETMEAARLEKERREQAGRAFWFGV